jgi:hypothetical protein
MIESRRARFGPSPAPRAPQFGDRAAGAGKQFEQPSGRDFDLSAEHQLPSFRPPAGTPNVDVAGVPANNSRSGWVRILMSQPGFSGRFRSPACMPNVASGGLAGSAGEQLQQRLGRDFDQPAEPQNRGRPLPVVHETVGVRAPHTEQRGSLNIPASSKPDLATRTWASPSTPTATSISRCKQPPLRWYRHSSQGRRPNRCRSTRSPRTARRSAPSRRSVSASRNFL